MADMIPDPNRSGSFKMFLPNSSGKAGFIGIDAGLTPVVKIGSAGNGIKLVAADGVTPILSVPEAGGVGVPTLAADPTSGDAVIYMLAGVPKIWTGTEAVELVTA